MDTHFLKQMIAVVRAEELRRLSLHTDENLDAENDQWLDTDEPFVNELCLMVLVTLRHQVERELVGLAARASDDGKEISRKEYDEEVRNLRKDKDKRKGWDWGTIKARLNLESCAGNAPMTSLRFLTNSYKHDPSMEPDDELLKSLELETGYEYFRLPESPALRERLATSVGLTKNAGYCAIAEQFIDAASGFLTDAQSHTKVRPFKREPISLVPAR
jgi:hypothetical protein